MILIYNNEVYHIRGNDSLCIEMKSSRPLEETAKRLFEDKNLGVSLKAYKTKMAYNDMIEYATIFDEERARLTNNLILTPNDYSLERSTSFDNFFKDIKDITYYIFEEVNKIDAPIYDKEKLLQAQKCPEENQDVIVRVWGYSAKFVDLCKEMQDNVISRIEINGQ